jgi:hypothetical protein
MIDATKSPLPTWKRYGLIVLVAALVVVAGAMIWTKELHHSLPGISKSKPAATQAAPPATTSTKTAQTVPTTIPGGIPVSSRNPFAG